MTLLTRVAVMILTGLLIPTAALAARVEVKGVGTYSYEGGSFSSSKPTDAEKAKAISAAKKAAWRNFVATLTPSKQKAITANADGAFDDLEKFIIDVTIIDISKNKEARTLNVVVRAAFNDEAVSQVVERTTVGSGSAGARSKDSLFSFLFMARQVDHIKTFDVRRAEVSKTESSTAVGADKGVATLNVAEQGGSNLKKQDDISYKVASSQDLDAAMGEVFSTSGIEYVAYDDIVANCDGRAKATFEAEYVNADELSPPTRFAIIKSAQSCDVRYLATGTIDSETATIDPVSGGQRVFVSVRAQLWDINKDQRLPRKVGSVGPRQFSGLGPSQAVAARNALISAARATAGDLVDQLNAKGIR